jgi:hypothetical protein
MNHLLGHEKSKIENHVYMSIRLKLQEQARILQKEIYKVMHVDSTNEEKHIILGKISSYLDTRNLLMPLVSSDRYTQEIEGAKNKLQRITSDNKI